MVSLKERSAKGGWRKCLSSLSKFVSLSPKSMYSRVPECQVTTYYYVGFAYLMMRRYQDAIRVFANILLYIQRTKSMFQRTTYKYEMVRCGARPVHYLSLTIFDLAFVFDTVDHFLLNLLSSLDLCGNILSNCSFSMSLSESSSSQSHRLPSTAPPSPSTSYLWATLSACIFSVPSSC